MTLNRICIARSALVAIVVSVGLLAGCGGSGSRRSTSSASSASHPPMTHPTVPPQPTTTVATATVSTLDVFGSADDAEPAQQLDSAPDYPLVLLVLATGNPDRVEVSLPTRPNGSTGWVRRSDVSLSDDPYRVAIDLSDHQLTAYEGSGVLLTATVGVGTADTPTPTGRFFITDLVEPPDANGAYGPYVFGLSAHSDVLDQFGGGDGQIGIHGTNQPELLGTDVSHGCIRMANPDILALTEVLPLGTPVEIQA